MTTTTNNNQQPAAGNVAAELAAATIGCRVSFEWIGQTKKLDDSQQAEAAAVFGANAEAVTMSKRLFDTKNEQYRNVTAVRSAIKRFWNNETLPFTEPGIRLLRRESAAAFAETMNGFQRELSEAVRELDNVFGELKTEARQRLGELYNAADYPDSLAGEFGVTYDFPNLAPPNYLATFSPELYQRESRRVAAQFEQAAELAENAFLAELATMVERVTETLTTGDNGKPRVFRDTLVSNFNAFFGRFRSLSIGSSAELVALVERAQNALAGVAPSALRTDQQLRENVRRSMATVSEALTAEANRPARRIRFNATAEPQPEPVQPIEPAAVVADQLAEPEPVAVAGFGVPLAVRLPAEAEAAEPVEPIATVGRAIADAFGLNGLPNVRVIDNAEPEPETQPEPNLEPVAEPVEPSAIEAAEAEAVNAIGETLAETAGVADQLAEAEPQPNAEPANVEPAAPSVALNFGRGRVVSMAVAS